VATDLQPINLPTVSPTSFPSAIDPLDSRYYDPEIAQRLSEQTRVFYQAYIEAALAHTLADYDICSREAATEIEKAASNISIEKVYEEEKITKHDVKAVVNCIKAQISEQAQPFVHFGATSYDIVATASALQMHDAIQGVVLPRLRVLIQTLITLVDEYAETTQVGRTHGQHAVPITFGFAIAEYVARLGENYEAIRDLTGMLRGKFSGAVGAYNALSVFIDDPLEFERKVLARVGLEPAPYSTQIIPAENMVRLMDELAISANIMANLGHDMRHLQRTEIAETREKFEKGQTGSSTMAHKRNPWNFENVVSMSKQVTAQIVNANMNLSSEHQRDLTDSASARFYTIIPASVASMASRLNTIMGKLEVDEAAMQRNLRLTGGAIAAEPLYLLFEKHGHTRAHEKSKELAHQALAESKPLADVVQADKEAKTYWGKFTEAERAIVTDPDKHYTGLATTKARSIHDYWKARLN
jgi:adenylosuccinate lyase